MTMRSKAAVSLPLLALLAACATAPEKGEFVSVQQVAAENKSKPWECADYDAATDSCDGLGRWTIKGDRVTAQTMAAIEVGDGRILNLTFNTKHTISSGQVCGLDGKVDLLINGKRFKDGENALSDFMKGFMGGVMQNVCAAYYRSGTGYYAEATTSDGKVLPDFSGTSTFFATKKKLRATKMQ